LRAAARVERVALKTVVNLVRDVGDMAIAFHKSSPKVSPREVQVDELWSFVGRNDYGYKPEERVPGEGVAWVYAAVDPETKLVIATHIGTRLATDATIFMRKIEQRLARDESGRLLVKPTIAFDGLIAYPDAVERAFADEVNAGVFEKIYDKQNRYIGSNRKPLVGSPGYQEINTWRIERENGFMRQVNRRLARKTNAFSKRQAFHERQIAIQVLHRNYCWVPHPRRPKDGSGVWEKQIPGAMAAGLTERIWTEEEIIERTDEFLASRDRVEPLGVEQGDDDPRERPFWVSHSAYHNRAKVHDRTCSTVGKAILEPKVGSRTGEWLSFRTFEEALAEAAKLKPDSHEVCRLCIGGYVTRSTYGRSR
jgi:IS1 family transposase